MQLDLIHGIKIKDNTNKVTGHRTYSLPSGLKFESVTTIIKKILGNPYQFAYIDPAIMLRARNIGSLVHSEIECFLQHGTPLGEIAQIHFDEMIKDLDVIRGIELGCYSLNGWAGRADLLAVHKEYGTCVLDWKNTGSKRKKTKSQMKNEMMQISLYTMALEETYKEHNVKVDNAILSIAHYNEECPVDYNMIVLSREQILENCKTFIEKLEVRGIDW